ncbi:MAG TPA: CbiQ family ECF transporter T component, partial [Candidatus Angelobacter sp.]|nr:CbiQ family ECF transporter T component [Candidatus Angelobacter sp.]
MSHQGTFAKTIVTLSRSLAGTLMSEKVARMPGLLQSLDPRVRVAGLFLLVVAVTLSHKIIAVLALLAAAALLALLSRVSLLTLATRVWLAVFLFTGVIALPALFLTPGATAFTVPVIGLTATTQGLTSAVLLILRVETAATLTTLLVLTTPWMHILKALRAFRVP